MGMVRPVLTVVIALVAATVARGQYAQSVFDLKKLSELYDERGFAQGKAISVDGKLMVSGSNGNVSYSYPISHTTVNGYPLDVQLNYCGSVAFTAFGDFYTGSVNDPYRRWSKFHQNRPAWIIGVNGFAIQALATTGSFHCESAVAGASSGSLFDDSKLVWAIDGYDFCNSMTSLEQEDQPRLVDEIHILRADGSLLQLVNEKYIGQEEPATYPEIYTGYYFANEANAHGFGIVEFDSASWPGFLHDAIDGLTGGIGTYPFVPRKLHYFPGDGLEYIFREWVIPYGIKPYLGRGESRPDRWGGVVAGPTIFYLDEIRSNLGPVTTFARSRQFHPNIRTTLNNGNIYDPIFESILDSTRGRALTTSFNGHTISYGDVGLTIEALGRTTKVLFQTQSRSGTAMSNEYMPLGTSGYMTYTAKALAAAQESASSIYKSFVGYVDKIVDPEGRETSFSYEPYTRTYINYGFPYTPSGGGSVAVRAKNYRLTGVNEPTASYTISYKRGNNLWPDEDTKRSDTLYQNVSDPTHNYPFLLNNVASYVRKYDRNETLLTTQYGVYSHDGTSFYGGQQTTTDNISGHVRTVATTYQSYPLHDYFTWLPHPRFTGLISTVETAGDLVTATGTNYDSMAQCPNMILPVKQTVTVNGVLKSDQRLSYTLDTVRKYGGNDTLTRKFGWEVARQVGTTLDPGTGSPLWRDTVEYTHVPLIDTALVRLDTAFLKFKMMENYTRLRDSGLITVPWEYAFYDPRVLAVRLDSQTTRGLLPPIYGLEKRSWRSDAGTSGRFLRGGEKFYRNPPSTVYYLNDLMARGVLDSETVTGEDRLTTVRAVKYTYTGGWKTLLGRTINANGAEQSMFYSLADLNTPGHPNYQAIGTIRYNNDTLRDTALPAADYYSLYYEKPVVQDQYVRYFLGSQLRVDTLRQSHEYTYYGLPKSTIDYNGNYSRFDYDRNGRLRMAWLPYDFPRREDPDTAAYFGTESIGLYGHTLYSALVDSLHCRQNGDTNTVAHDSTADTVIVEGLYAAHPIGDVPECTCGEGPFIKSKRRDDPGLLASCIYTVGYPVDEYYTGVLRYRVDSASPLLTFDPLSSVYLDLHTTSISEGCVTLTVEIPQFGFTRSITFNCGDEDTSHDGTGRVIGGDGKGARGASLLAGEENARLVRVTLTSLASSLRSLNVGDGLTIYLKVTTADGAIRFVDGSNGEDTRPKLTLRGTIHKVNDEADYTLAYTHNDTTLTTTVGSKVDDDIHTANRYGRASNYGSSRRYTESKHYFGADYRLNRSTVSIGRPAAPVRLDSVVHAYSGFGERIRTRDPELDTIVTRYDTAGRPVETINPDGTHVTVEYAIATPDSFGIVGQNFYGFCMRKRSTDERGIIAEQYYDAFDRLRREGTGISLSTTAGPIRVVSYEYDLLGNLTQVTNPAGQVTTYTYDGFGRVKTKQMPSVGKTSYAYDDLGNIRFTQNEEQARRNLLSFTEYDDLNRPTLIGEAVIAREGCASYCEDSLYASGYPCEVGGTAGRLTETIDPRVLAISRRSSILTANPTIGETSTTPPPSFHVTGSSIADTIVGCGLEPDTLLLGETTSPVGPMLMHTAKRYELCADGAGVGDFEDVLEHPEFPRIAIAYDRMPASGGLWATLPPKAVWEKLAPTGKLRNQKGHEAVVACRERGSEPYHYTALSYDDRGRVEAILRCTENLGFDAVYYQYNAMDQVTSVTVADPLRSHTSWYGYDYNGRIDSVWTTLRSPGSGLLPTDSVSRSQGRLRYPPALASEIHRPAGMSAPDIVYEYTRSGQLAHMEYPHADVAVEYSYTNRKWLKELLAHSSGSTLPLFLENLTYDSSGQITEQHWYHDGVGTRAQKYGYDNHDQLVEWWTGTDTVSYSYDLVGNRTGETDTRVPGIRSYDYDGSANQLTGRTYESPSGQLTNDTTQSYAYDGNGNLRRRIVSRKDWLGLPHVLLREEERYSYRGLFNRSYQKDSTSGYRDWRYRYSASGEREQKRLVDRRDNGIVTHPDSAKLAWVYYALGGNNQQLAVYHGQEVAKPLCGDSGRRVYMYPTEYLTYGAGTSMNVTTDANGVKSYKIGDHLGSTRMMVTGTSVSERSDYEPFGKREAVAGVGSRKGYIDREEDLETGMGNFGVRQMKERFWSPDPLWEKYRAWSPYTYSGNNPLKIIDPSGASGDTITDAVDGLKKVGESIYDEAKKEILDEIENPLKVVVKLCPPCQAVEQTLKLTTAEGRKDVAIDLAINFIPVRVPRIIKVNVIRYVRNMTIVDRGVAILNDVTVDLKPTLDRIQNGIKHSHKNDGSVFKNRGNPLPQQGANYYREYVHPTPGAQGPGPQRIVTGQGGEVYYTPDHYQTFYRLDY